MIDFGMRFKSLFYINLVKRCVLADLMKGEKRPFSLAESFHIFPGGSGSFDIDPCKNANKLIYNVSYNRVWNLGDLLSRLSERTRAFIGI